jgi:hypothetical protein
VVKDLDDGFFQLSPPIGIFSWVLHIVGVLIFLLAGYILMASFSEYDHLTVSEAIAVTNPSEITSEDFYTLGDGFEGQKGAYLTFEAHIQSGDAIYLDCRKSDDSWLIYSTVGWKNIIMVSNEGEVITHGLHDDFEFVLTSRECNSYWSTTLGGNSYLTMQVFALKTEEGVAILSFGEDDITPPEVTNREDVQRTAMIVGAIAALILMVGTPSSLKNDTHAIRKTRENGTQYHHIDGNGVSPITNIYRDKNDENDWLFPGPTPDTWNLDSPYEGDENDKIIPEHPTQIGTPNPATFTLYTIWGILFISLWLWVASDLFARDGNDGHRTFGEVLRYLFLIVTLIWGLVSFNKWKVIHNIIDTPTSLVRSVAVGPCEIVGQARPILGKTLSAKIATRKFGNEEGSAHGMLNYRWVEEELVCTGSGKDRSCNWRTRKSGGASVPMLAHDGTGGIYIDPNDFTKPDFGSPLKIWKTSKWRWVLHAINAGDPIYALGYAEKRDMSELESEGLDGSIPHSLLKMTGQQDVGMHSTFQRGTELSVLTNMRSTTEAVVIPVLMLICAAIPFLW